MIENRILVVDPDAQHARVVHQEAAVRAHRATGCAGYSRTDFIVTADERITALEVNTLPGLTPRSLLPLEAAADGVSFEALCLEILQLAGSRE